MFFWWHSYHPFGNKWKNQSLPSPACMSFLPHWPCLPIKSSDTEWDQCLLFDQSLSIHSILVSLIIPFEAQEPESWVMILPILWMDLVMWSINPKVAPLSSHFFLPSSWGQSLPFQSSTHYTISIPSSPSAIVLYSFPKGCSLQGTHIHLGQY